MARAQSSTATQPKGNATLVPPLGLSKRQDWNRARIEKREWKMTTYYSLTYIWRAHLTIKKWQGRLILLVRLCWCWIISSLETD